MNLSTEKRLNLRSGILTSLPQIAALITFLFYSSASAQWERQSPVPTGLEIRGIGSPTTQRIFIATSDNPFDSSGALFESPDGGDTWIPRNIPQSLGDALNGLFFLDDLKGWAFGNYNYRTTDGGTSWTELPFLGSTYFMKFYTPSFGAASGNFGKAVSTDSGDSWIESPHSMFEFSFANNQTGIGVSDSGIYKTTDGGSNFLQVQTGSASAVVFLTGTRAAAIVNDIFMSSTDGGSTWSGGAPALGKTHLVKISSAVLLAWGRTGTFPDYDYRILRSSDGGSTWNDLGEVINPGGYSTSFAFAVPDSLTVSAADGAGNMFYSSDAGLNWSQTFTSPGPLPSFFSSAAPVFADAQTGYFGYGAGFIVKTSDGGASWFQVSSGTGNTLNDIDRFPDGSMIAVGDNGTLLMKSSTSSKWIFQPALSQFDMKAVQVTGPDEVVAADETGQVYLSSDGGASWATAPSKPVGLSPVEGIKFNDLQNGWIIGQGVGPAILYHTSNGGNTWNEVTGFLGAYVEVDAEGSNVWAANVGGVYYRSTDFGTTWVQGFLPGSQLQVMDMDFYNENVGYAVGWYGDAFRSSDGGISWQELPTPNHSDQLTGIYLISQDELWISTNSDAAYYTANGGQNWAVLNISSGGFGNFSSIAADQNGNAWTAGYQGYIEYFIGPPPPPLNQPPTADFSFIADGLTVYFTDTSIDPDGMVTSWLWDFGDSITSTQQNPVHTFDTADTYIVKLRVADNEGAMDSTIRIIAVQPNPGGVFGNFTEVTPLDSVFVTPQDEDFWVITTAPADYDNDGDLDIAVLGYYVVYFQSVDERLLLLKNNGSLDSVKWDFTYASVPFVDLSAGASDLAWGDVDGDGDQDLVVGTDGETVLYRNDNGTLVLTDTNLPGYLEDNYQAEFDLHSISWADYDNDGDPDLLIPSVFDQGTFSFRTALMRNDGPNGTGGFIFTETDSVFAPTLHGGSTWADYDNDQDLDLLLFNAAPLTDESFIIRYRNDGNGNFFGENILGDLTIQHGEAQWGDFDSDGDLDILIAGNVLDTSGIYNTVLRIYRNDTENYTPIDVINCIPCEGWFDLTAATWADYDNDGDMDILLAGNYNSGSQIEGRARIYTNNGSGIFNFNGNELPAPRASGTRGGTFSWLDLDVDGDLDYFIAGQYFVPGGNGLVEAQMHAYRNDSPGLNNGPSTPTGLNAALLPGSTVKLTWAPSYDDHTPGIALTYDISLFREGVPMAVPGRLPEPGNVSAGVEWLLADLPDGNYTWTLRAVDAAYIGSPAVTGNFSVGVLTSADHSTGVPDEYSLDQNYPNPFNPSTTIQYALREEGHAVMKIYNSLGEEVSALVNEFKPAGYYTINFSSQNLPSGIYFYRLTAGNFSETRKMILLK